MKISTIGFSLIVFAGFGMVRAEEEQAPTPASQSVLKSTSRRHPQAVPYEAASEFCETCAQCGCSSWLCRCPGFQELRRRLRLLKSKSAYSYDQLPHCNQSGPRTYYYYRPYNSLHVWQHLAESGLASDHQQRPYSNTRFEDIYRQFAPDQVAPEQVPAPAPQEVEPSNESDVPAELRVKREAVRSLDVLNDETIQLAPVLNEPAGKKVLEILQSSDEAE